MNIKSIVDRFRPMCRLHLLAKCPTEQYNGSHSGLCAVPYSASHPGVLLR